MTKKYFSVQDSLNNIGIHQLNEVQRQSLKAFKTNKDLILTSPTGSGKTLAFVLPIIEWLLRNPKKHCMIITPTRELSLQIETVIKSLKSPFKVNSCYGGHPFKTEVNNLRTLPEFLIGTPGRIADHIRRKSFELGSFQKLVLDEFDKSLELGFHHEMEYIIYEMKAINQFFLTSATKIDTLPPFVQLKQTITIEKNKHEGRAELSLKMVRSEENDKLDILVKLLCHIGNEASLIFCNHRESTERISNLLKQKGIAHECFHGGLEQEIRERALIKFRNHSHHTLITTDLASRGLDIPQIKHVIHYHVPSTEEVYIHRNGRTARMDNNGSAWIILKHNESLPEYLKEDIPETKLSSQPLPQLPKWQTLYIGGGKKDKINKVDIVGLLGNKTSLSKDEIGLIEVKDRFSYVAVARSKTKEVLRTLKDERIKRKKVKFAISK